jgi:hypothetical protein
VSCAGCLLIGGTPLIVTVVSLLLEATDVRILRR